MVTRLTPSDRDLQSLAELVSRERPDLPEAGLPLDVSNRTAAVMRASPDKVA
jgi:hypothetical protein